MHCRPKQNSDRQSSSASHGEPSPPLATQLPALLTIRERTSTEAAPIASRIRRRRRPSFTVRSMAHEVSSFVSKSTFATRSSAARSPRSTISNSSERARPSTTSPTPSTLMRVPRTAPAGTSTETVSRAAIHPTKAQDAQPASPHFGHGVRRTMSTATDCAEPSRYASALSSGMMRSCPVRYDVNESTRAG